MAAGSDGAPGVTAFGRKWHRLAACVFNWHSASSWNGGPAECPADTQAASLCHYSFGVFGLMGAIWPET